MTALIVNFGPISDGARPRNGRRGRDHPRGGHDSFPALSSSTPSDPRRQFKGQGGKKYQRQQQSSNKSSVTSEGSAAAEKHQAAAIALDDEFEVGSVFNAGSKKQNLSHLLNFQFEPRGNSSSNQRSRVSKTSGGGRKKNAISSRPKYNKEQYLQAK